MKLDIAFSYIFTNGGFVTTLIINTLFMYMTCWRIKKITGTYKVMVLVFSAMGMFFSAWELIARPFAHSYNKALVYFSLNTWLSHYHGFLEFAIIFYASFYLIILAVIAVQFVFRYFTLYKQEYSRRFGGAGVILWMSYAFLAGAIYGGSLYYFCRPDNDSDDYMRNVIADSYNLSITTLARFAILPYESDDSIRWDSLKFLTAGVATLSFQYIIIIYCGVRMHSVLQKELAQQSIVNRKLQKQFFRALVVQTVIPTFLFVLPIAPFLIGQLIQPVFHFEMSFPTGWMYVVLCLYPPIDSIAFMMIVSEYRSILIGLLKLGKSRVTSEFSTSTPATVME